jgi:hypothetical protein
MSVLDVYATTKPQSLQIYLLRMLGPTDESLLMLILDNRASPPSTIANCPLSLNVLKNIKVRPKNHNTLQGTSYLSHR